MKPNFKFQNPNFKMEILKFKNCNLHSAIRNQNLKKGVK